MCPIWYEDEVCLVYMMWQGISTYAEYAAWRINGYNTYKRNENLDHHATSLRQPKIFAYCIIQNLSISKCDES